MVAKTTEDNRRANGQQAAADSDYQTEMAAARHRGLRHPRRGPRRGPRDPRRDARPRQRKAAATLQKRASDELKQQSDAIAADLRSSVETLSANLGSRFSASGFHYVGLSAGTVGACQPSSDSSSASWSSSGSSGGTWCRQCTDDGQPAEAVRNQLDEKREAASGGGADKFHAERLAEAGGGKHITEEARVDAERIAPSSCGRSRRPRWSGSKFKADRFSCCAPS